MSQEIANQSTLPIRMFNLALQGAEIKIVTRKCNPSICYREQSLNCEVSMAPFVYSTKIGRSLVAHSDLHLHNIQALVQSSPCIVDRAYRRQNKLRNGCRTFFTRSQINSAAGLGCHAPISSLLTTITCY